MVARLKLKEIDGRAPPGVRIALSRSSALNSSLKGLVVALMKTSRFKPATPSNCGELLKLSITKLLLKGNSGLN